MGSNFSIKLFLGYLSYQQGRVTVDLCLQSIKQITIQAHISRTAFESSPNVINSDLSVWLVRLSVIISWILQTCFDQSIQNFSLLITYERNALSFFRTPKIFCIQIQLFNFFENSIRIWSSQFLVLSRGIMFEFKEILSNTKLFVPVPVQEIRQSDLTMK